MTNIRVGLIGFGLSGSTFHAPLINQTDGFELCAVTSTRHEAIKARFPNMRIFEQAYDLLEFAQTELDLVIITSPNDTHFELAHGALERNLHVVLEKPMVLSSIEGESLRALAKRKRRVLTVFHNRRYDSDFLTIRRLLQQQKLGPVHTYIAQFDRYRPVVRERWKEQTSAGGGVLYDLGSHLIDQALCLFGMPVSVLADLKSQRPGADAVDNFWMRLDYPGLQVTLKSGSLVLEPGPRFQIHGQHGSFIKYGKDVQERQLTQDIALNVPEFGVEPESQHGQLTTIAPSGAEEREQAKIPSERGTYASFYQKLGQAINEGGAPPVSATEAINVIRIIEAAIESSQLGSAVELRNS